MHAEIYKTKSGAISIVKPGYLYIIRFEHYYKIGKSERPYERIKLLTRSLPIKPEIILIAYANNINMLESHLHVQYKAKRTNNIKNKEWFYLDAHDIQDIREYLTGYGVEFVD